MGQTCRRWGVLFLLTIALVFPRASYAGEEEVHLAAHVGVSAALSMISYGYFHKVLKMSRPLSLVLATLSTLAVGFAYEYAEDPSGALQFSSEARTSMLRNSLGVGVGIISIAVFKF